MRSTIRRYRNIAGIAAGAALLFAATGPAVAQKAGGTLKVYAVGNPPSASIHEEATISTVMPYMAVYNNLVMFDQNAKQNSLDAIVPDLGLKWAWSDDNTKLTFDLAEGVKWHDGKPFSSADVKCTWDRLLERGDDKLRKNPRKPWYFNLEEVTTDGPNKVTFHLKRPQPSFLVMLAAAFSPVYSCHVPQRDMRTAPIGTGPFKFVDYRQNEYIKLARNPDYWKKERPYLDAIEWQIMSNRSTRILAFTAGQFDLTFTHDISIPQLRNLREQLPNAECSVDPSNTQTTLLLNRDAKPFDNPDVRRAIQLSVDRQAFVDILSEGQSKIGGTMLPLPEGLWGIPPDRLQSVVGYDPDIEKSRAEARELLKKAGFGSDNPLKFKLYTRDYSSWRDASVIFIDHLAKIGVTAELDILETQVWYTRLARKDYGIALSVTGLGVDDPDVNFYENYGCESGRNYTQYCNRELSKLFDEQSAMLDQEKRRALVHEIDQKLQEDGARPVIFHGRSGTCWHPHVKNVKLAVNSIYNHWRFEDVWLDR